MFQSTRRASDHLLRQIGAVMKFNRVRSFLADRGSSTGRPSIDPEPMLRMLLIGYAYGIRPERRLCSEVHLNLFCRLGLSVAVPDPFDFLEAPRWAISRERLAMPDAICGLKT